MKRKINSPSTKFILFALLIFSTSYSFAQRKMESLDRGVVAIKVYNGVYISWRLLGDEIYGVDFNIYRNGIKLNSSPISQTTDYLDSEGLISSTYVITKIKDGIETTTSKPVNVWMNHYLDIPVRTIDGVYSTYEINDGSVGDLDGDGEYEIIIKRLALNMDINSSDYHYLEAYKLDGTFLWAINLGPNIYNQVEVNFLVYDFDEDGKAEIATRTSEGTIDGLGNIIGDIDGDGVTNYRNSITYYGYRSEGPDFISVFDGETGKEITRANYIALAPISQWGLPGMNIDQYAHRGTKCMWTVAYLDGKHPSIVNARGIYERIKMEAWDFNGSTLTKRWSFDSDPGGVRTSYHGQGNHNLSLADVDQDGKDEIVYASMVVDDDGTGLYSTGLGHGDALHVFDMDPDRPGLEIWGCHETSPAWGATYRDAQTGEIMLHYSAGRDMGRCAAGDITASHKGAEMWGGGGDVFYNVKGEIIGNSPPTVNYMIWWDGDLLREFCDHTWLGTEIGAGTGTISKYNGSANLTRLLYATGTYSNNYTKGTPVLQADILGDWREEVMWRSVNNDFIRLYSTTYKTTYRIPTLMHEPQYRIAVAWQNNSYNQPPHTGIYLGAEMQDNIPYPISNNKVIWNTGINWDNNTSANWKDADGNSIVFQDGADVLFDLTGDNSQVINISSVLSPRTVTFTSPGNYEFSGMGNLSSSMSLYKAGTGKLTINNTNDYSGKTKILYGQLVLNGELTNSPVEVGMFGELFANGVFGNGIRIKTDGKLQIGPDNNSTGTAYLNGDLLLETDAKIIYDLSDDSSGVLKNNDKINITGNLVLQDNIRISIRLLDDSLAYGSYELLHFTGICTGNISKNAVSGIEGISFELIKTDSSLILEILKPRPKTKIEWNGNLNHSTWDVTLTKNWNLNTDTTWFLEGDTVIFNDNGILNNLINIQGDVMPAQVEVNSSGTYTFSGEGSIEGATALIKSGTGKLIIGNMNYYTGPTIVKSGIIETQYLGNAGEASPLGAAGNMNDNIVFEGGTLIITSESSTSNKNIKLNTSGGSIYVGSNKALTLYSEISGTGKLIKSGMGKINLSGSNTYSGGTIIKNGEIYLQNKTAISNGLGSGSVTMESGILSMNDDPLSASLANWDIIIPELTTSMLRTDSRSTLAGSLTGKGNLNLYLPGNFTELQGNWSQFSGNITAMTDVDGGRLILSNTEGYGNLSLHLNNKITAVFKNSTTDTIEIGALSGNSGSELGSGGNENSVITWKIGGKNTSFTFDGLISNTSYTQMQAVSKIIKTGSGEMKISNSNTYSGGTVIENGTLTLTNTTGSATGTGQILIKHGGTLSGNGYTSSSVVVETNGVLSPGISDIGQLNIANTVEMQTGSYYLAEVNTDSLKADILHVMGTINLNGILYLSVTGAYSLTDTDSIKILEAYKTNGNFSSILPVSPGKGLEWDTSTLSADGYLRIKKTGETPVNPLSDIMVSREIYPNPTNGEITIITPDKAGNCTVKIINLMGQLVYLNEFLPSRNQICVNVSHLLPGSYLISISDAKYTSVSKIIINDVGGH